jgi:hypothetical protein
MNIERLLKILRK